MTSRLTSAPCVSAVSMAAKRARLTLSTAQAALDLPGERHLSAPFPRACAAAYHPETGRPFGRERRSPSPLGGHQLATASVIAELATKFVRGRDNTFTSASATSAQGAEAHA